MRRSHVGCKHSPPTVNILRADYYDDERGLSNRMSSTRVNRDSSAIFLTLGQLEQERGTA